MPKKILLSLSVLLLAAPYAYAQSMTSDLDAQIDSDYSSASSGSVSATSAADASDDDAAASSGADDRSSVSTVDASGNMTVNTNEDYLSAIDLKTGNLTVGTDASAKSIRVRGGNVTLKSNTDVDSVTVDVGSLTMGDNVTISGNVIVGGKLTAGKNLDITGSVSVGSAGTITIGDNSDITGTLTSPAGLRIGSNSDIKLFLSGKAGEIDGKVYKLGGTILASGANTSVGLPFVPKLKDGQVMTAASTSPLEMPESVAASSEPERSSGADEDDDWASGSDDFFLPDIAGIQDDEDITSYVSDVISANTDVRALKLTSEAVNLDYEAPAALFGFIPMTVPARISVSKDKTVDVSYPWYSFLMSTNEEELQDAVSKTVGDALSASAGDTQDGFSAKIQATIANSILSAFKNFF